MQLQKRNVVLASVVLLSAGAANAAIDPAVSAGLTTLQADAATLGGLVMTAVVAVMLIMLGVRLVKKLLGKAV